MMKNLLSALKTWSGSILKQPASQSAEARYSWMKIAELERGVTELSADKHNERILQYHATTTLKAKTDEVPWCSSFVNWCLKQAGYPITGSAAARSWAKYGVACKPQPGCIVVMTRNGGGHVGFYVRETAKTVYILGGNQANSVCISGFSKERVLNYKLPKELNANDAKVHDALNPIIS